MWLGLISTHCHRLEKTARFPLGLLEGRYCLSQSQRRSATAISLFSSTALFFVVASRGRYSSIHPSQGGFMSLLGAWNFFCSSWVTVQKNTWIVHGRFFQNDCFRVTTSSFFRRTADAVKNHLFSSFLAVSIFINNFFSLSNWNSRILHILVLQG